ncbi:MAG: ATP-binding protein [bacterium]
MERRSVRFGIVARISIAFGALVFCTALIVSAGSDIRVARLYRSQRVSRVKFLARSMSYGIENLLVSSGSRGQIEQVADDVLRKAASGDTSVTGCEIRDRANEVVYRFVRTGATIGAGTNSVAVDVKSKNLIIGSITLYYDIPDIFENEKMRQVVTLGNTVAEMLRYYLSKYDFFQVKYLSQRIIESDPDVLYASVTGPDESSIYEYRMRSFDKYLTPEVIRRAMSVSAVQPVVTQKIAASNEFGNIVEVSVLIGDGENRLGIVRIGYSTASLVKSLARERLVLSLMIFGFTLIAFGLAVLLAGNITRPLAELTRLARSVELEPKDADGRTAADAEQDLINLRDSFDRLGSRLTKRGDEVADLATAFRTMIDNLEKRIRELKTFYQKISVADRFYAMGQLSSGIAHEINNPLAIISTYVQIILKRPDVDAETRAEIETIREEIERIAEKVKDLLSFAQESKFDFAVSDVHALMRKSLDLTRHQFKKNNIAVEEEYASASPLMIRMDPQKLRQVLLNLILNAIQAMTDSPRRVLRVGTIVNEENNTVEAFFSDSGCGIAKENLESIFDPFFTTKKTGVGTGLGLSISYGIVTAHNGELRAESTPGEGATFRIILPRE